MTELNEKTWMPGSSPSMTQLDYMLSIDFVVGADIEEMDNVIV